MNSRSSSSRRGRSGSRSRSGCARPSQRSEPRRSSRPCRHGVARFPPTRFEATALHHAYRALTCGKGRGKSAPRSTRRWRRSVVAGPCLSARALRRGAAAGPTLPARLRAARASGVARQRGQEQAADRMRPTREREPARPARRQPVARSSSSGNKRPVKRPSAAKPGRNGAGTGGLSTIRARARASAPTRNSSPRSSPRL